MLAMAAWLAGLAVARRSGTQGWAALTLSSSVVLLLGESVIALPRAAIIAAGGVFLAAGLRFLSRYLDVARDRPFLAYLLDGCIFAIFLLGAVARIRYLTRVAVAARSHRASPRARSPFC